MWPYPTAGDINVLGQTNNNSIYHGGTASLVGRVCGGIGFRFNYTFSKSIDDNTDGQSDTPNQLNWGFSKVQNPTDRKSNRSVPKFDSRHRFNVTSNYELPFGKGRRFF